MVCNISSFSPLSPDFLIPSFTRDLHFHCATLYCIFFLLCIACIFCHVLFIYISDISFLYRQFTAKLPCLLSIVFVSFYVNSQTYAVPFISSFPLLPLPRLDLISLLLIYLYVNRIISLSICVLFLFFLLYTSFLPFLQALIVHVIWTFLFLVFLIPRSLIPSLAQRNLSPS